MRLISDYMFLVVIDLIVIFGGISLIHVIYSNIDSGDPDLLKPGWANMGLYVILFLIAFFSGWEYPRGIALVVHLFLIPDMVVDVLWPQPEGGIYVLPAMVSFWMTNIYLYILASLGVWLTSKVRRDGWIRTISG